MSYRVGVTKEGLFRATKGDEFFECEYWGVFARELECRLTVEKREEVWETVAISKWRKSDSEIF